MTDFGLLIVKVKRLALAGLLCLTVTSSCAPAPELSELRLYGREGPTANLIRALVLAFNCTSPAPHVAVVLLDASEIDGRIGEEVARSPSTIGFLGRHLKNTELAYVSEEAIDPPDGGVVIAVNASSTRRDLRVDQVADLLAGKLSDITAVAITPRGTLARDLADRFIAASGRGDAIKEVASARAALALVRADIGTVALLPLRDVEAASDVRMLSINGVQPSIDRIRDQQYPLRVWFAFVLPLHRTDPTAAALINLARSAQGSNALLAAYSDSPARPTPACTGR